MASIYTSIGEIQWSDFIRPNGPIHLFKRRADGTMRFGFWGNHGPEDDNSRAVPQPTQYYGYNADLRMYFTYHRDALLNVIRSRPSLMFRSNFKHDTRRITFLDLPAEVRNMIYDYALFDYEHSQVWDIDLCGPNASCSRDNGPLFQTELTIATMKIMGAMNKQIRLEVRSRFWGTITARFYPTKKEDHDLLGQCASLLKTLGGLEDSNPAYFPESHSAFQRFLVALKCCRELHILQLNLSLSNLFWGNEEALRSYFLDGESLKSSSLDHLVKALTSLPSLEKVDIWNVMADEWNDNHTMRLKSENPFFRFAFSGLRRQKLWIAVYKRLRANHRGQKSSKRKLNDKVMVRMNHPCSPYKVHPGSDTLNYEEWLAWYYTLCDDPNHRKRRWWEAPCSCQNGNGVK